MTPYWSWYETNLAVSNFKATEPLNEEAEIGKAWALGDNKINREDTLDPDFW